MRGFPITLLLLVFPALIGDPVAQAVPDIVSGDVRQETLILDRIINVRELPKPTPSEAVTPSLDAGHEHTEMPEFQAGGTIPLVNVVDGGVRALLPSSPPTLVSQFVGLNNGDNNARGLQMLPPPDAQAAVGTTRVTEMVNFVGAVYDKTNFTQITSFKLNDFFGVLTPRCREGAAPPCWSEADPKLLYDAISGRWIATYFSKINKPSGQLG